MHACSNRPTEAACRAVAVLLPGKLPAALTSNPPMLHTTSVGCKYDGNVNKPPVELIPVVTTIS
jgi:hypothetical protein